MEKASVSSSQELAKKLKECFKERLMIESISSYYIEGILDGKRINITYMNGDNLIISIRKEYNDLLQEVYVAVRDAMNGIDPICVYDINVYDYKVKEPLTNIEWNFKDPDSRLRDIVNGRAFSSRCRLENLKLCNGKDISDYDERFDKIYGIYPGSIRNVERINNLSEVELYLSIDKLGSHIHRCNDAMRHRGNFFVDLSEDQYALEYMVYQTRKFGVVLPEPTRGHHIIPTASYWKWLKFYDQHFKHTLTDMQWMAFQLSRKYGIDVSRFLPVGNWNDEVVENRVK